MSRQVLFPSPGIICGSYLISAEFWNEVFTMYFTVAVCSAQRLL